MRLIDRQIAALCSGQIPPEIRSFYSQIGVNLQETIAPMISPFEPSLVNPASIDIRVGTSVKLMKHIALRNQLLYLALHGRFPVAEFVEIDLTSYSAENPFWLFRKDRALVPSLETFNLSPFLTGTFKLKSSRGREFYQHIMAGFCDPGWHGSKLTMELANLSVVPLPLYPGMKIGQVVFDMTFGIPLKDYSLTGRYNGDSQAMESKCGLINPLSFA